MDFFKKYGCSINKVRNCIVTCSNKYNKSPRDIFNILSQKYYFVKNYDQLFKSSVVLGHGRKHRILTSINYEFSLFIDNDISCQPDIVADLRSLEIKQNLKHIIESKKYDEIIWSCSDYILIINGIPHYELLNYLYSILEYDGELFLSNIYKDKPMNYKKLDHSVQQEESQVKLLIHDIENNTKFKFDRFEKRLDISKANRLVFKK
jgi:hypothetical protein